MKKIVLLLSLAVMETAHAQIYGDYDLGMAFRPLNNNSSLLALHIGYQFNEVFTPNGIGLIEYDQRSLLSGVSPVYLGGRIGYGLNTGEFTSVSLWGGRYFRLLSDDNIKKINYWIPGYGASFIWKNIVVDISKVEFYQVAIGCHYLLD